MDLIIFLKKAAIRLPKPVRIILKKPWRMWLGSVKWDDQMLSLIAGYFKISKKEVKFFLKYGEKLDAFFWNYLKLKHSEEFFYKNTPFYIFELAFWHMTRYQRLFRYKIIELSQGRILDFGGGIGDLSLRLKEKGFQVDYADVAGETLNFAKYLFLKNNSSVKIIDLSKNKIMDNYDTIVCIDVIEHLKNQKETLDLFLNHLNSGGTLIVTNLEFSEINEDQYHDHPMHIPIGFDAKKYLLDKGLKETKYPWAFIKKPK